MRNNCYKTFFFAIGLLFTTAVFSQEKISMNDFSKATIIIPGNTSKQEQAAIKMLVEEIEKRTTIALPTAVQFPDHSTPVIVVSTLASFKNDPGALLPAVANEAEGFTMKLIKENGKAPAVHITGNDSRGMLFGTGYFLRKIFMEKQQLFVPDNISIVSHPATAIRGHQLGYRPKTNAYDGLDEKMWEQYIRDLIVFGTNSIELMPPFTDDDSDSPMFPLPQMDMMMKMSQLLENYGLNSWIWYPLMFGDYSKAENAKKSLEESEKIFSKLVKVDAIFVPGGDPGHLKPEILFKHLEKQAAVLHKYHPKAEIWVSPQGFNQSWMNEFMELVKSEPKWLTGIVYGPQISMNLNEFRKKIPAKYPIRRYPDITHCFDAQYPVPNWDFAFAATQNRESINPRPLDQATIFHAAAPNTNIGFITYSEGLNDDVNKIVWSGLGWNPAININEILQDYSRYFIGKNYTYDFAQGLLNLEQNWNGSLLNNSLVNVHHSMFQLMEKTAPPQVRLNWRFQLALYRSYYDAYNRNRLIYETQLEAEALDILRKAPLSGSLTAMQEAQKTLNNSRLKPVSGDLRQRVFELAEALFQSTRMQLSVEKYFAIGIRRGANLDLIDYPLNNRGWLEEQFIRIAKIENENDRLKEIELITNWTNPGPGGYYDDLGDWGNQPHLVSGAPYKEDPAFYRSPLIGYAPYEKFSPYEKTLNWRVSWARYVQTLHGHPLTMHYTNLDTTAQYEVKVTYVGEGIRLAADDLVIHDYNKRGTTIGPVTFDVPRKATLDGNLTLEWTVEPGKGGTGRGSQVAEVWLMKKRE